ncbi:HEAT repeat domain-containing protein [Streptomyces gobiensis]|uniref:HEAT repeat domain-containing protein n=1 Tax=Streptomyces gobiensis TaxID=2875706 RepID=UPI001E604351|nr:HEAT repeat domain-containing protein [Streptomyces gobiensis]UGY94365.1 HEAT repeat domain-containing protein [Streptomyces gobiensis]
MDDQLQTLARRVRGEAERAECERLLALVRRGDRAAHDELALVLTEPGRPLWMREIAAYALGCAGDRRAFETLVFLLNYRDPARGATAAAALARLGDPRTARAAATLATNELRTAYALHPIRLLAQLGAPESVPVLITTLRRLLAGPDHYWPIARACAEGLGQLGDPRARTVLTAAREFDQLRAVADKALRCL